MKHKRITSKKTIQEIRKSYCEICGQRTNIEPHHINTRGSGGGDIKENLIQLCTQCHINTHSGQYPTKDDCLNKVAEREGITYVKKWQKSILKISIIHIGGEDVQRHMQNQSFIYAKDAMD